MSKGISLPFTRKHWVVFLCSGSARLVSGLVDSVCGNGAFSGLGAVLLRLPQQFPILAGDTLCLGG